MDEYFGSYAIRWSDLDANGHVNYASYIDATGDLRYRFFTEHGFPPEKFAELGIGPIYTDIHASFLREVRMGETITINLFPIGSFTARAALESPSRYPEIKRKKSRKYRHPRDHTSSCHAQSRSSNARIIANLQPGAALT